MSYLNRFIIEEDTQFECAGIIDYENNKRASYLLYDDFFNDLNRLDYVGHLFVSAESGFLIPSILDLPCMITRIGSERLECIQKEQYENFYNEGGQITYHQNSSIRPLQVYKSTGDDIDYFYDSITTHNMNLENMRTSELFALTSLDSALQFGIIRKISFSDLLINSVKTFHLSMLSDEEEKKMHSEETGYRKFDNFKKYTKLSKKEQNYALSLCARRSSFRECGPHRVVK